MFNKKSSRHSLALFVALALGSGTLLTAASVNAADVSGNDVTIDNTHAPSDNAIDPGSNHVIGTAAGFIKDAQDGGNVTNNKLTFNGISSAYPKHLYGGLTFGAGNVTGNHVIVNSATLPLLSSVDGIFGGAANNGGNVTDNHATFNGTHLNGDLVGGMTNMSGTGTVKENTATLKGGNVHGSIYGGLAGHGASGDVVENKVTIEGGTVTGTEKVYGGYTTENGNVKGNTVTIKGGTLSEIYGGYSDGTGEVSGNTVNLGDGMSAMAAGYAINGTIYGGKNTADATKVSNNTLNVNTNAVAHNIKNFSTINFNFNASTNAASSLLTLSDSTGTQIASLEQIHLSGAPLDKSEGTLIENTHGITLGAYSGAVSRTMEKTESIIDRDGMNKIGYKYYQFKGSTEAKSDSTAIWGGRSILGNTTTDNEVTVSGNHAGKKAYGGWTSGTGSTATGENARNHSIGNKITLTGATSEVHHMTGGSTNIVGGKATGNHAILSNGRVTGTLAGGSAADGEVSGNTVEINGGRVDGTTYGGTTGGAGTAKNNKVTLSNGTVHSDIFGGVTTNGAATENKVNITGGSAAGHDVYGGFSTSGDTTGNTVDITGGSVRDVYGGNTTSGNATGNIVNITGGSVRNVDGGRSLSGNATGNTVNIGSADAAFAGSINGIINGGSGMGFGKDYRTDNKLNVYGNATASNIKNFAEINFHFNAHVNQSNSFLTLSDVGGTTLHSLSDLKINGEHGRKGTLLKNTGGTITISEGGDRLVKTNENKELVLAKSSDSKRIDYEGYQFKGATNTTTVEDGANKDIFGGRSIGANTTTGNNITVSDAATYRNVYGGWTSGAGTTAADKDNSTNNKVTVKGSANVTNTVYGGFTEAANGKATGNEVTVEKNLAANIVGGKAAAEASGNTVNLASATVNSITGGEGTTTNNNTVNLKGNAQVTGALKGGTAANGTGNTLNITGTNNKAGSISGFQKLTFDTTNADANPMLQVTGGAATDVDWTTLTATGAASETPKTLMENAAGINTNGRTGDAVKSELNTDATMETNIDVVKSSSTVTKLVYEGYTVKGSTKTTTYGADTWAGRSKAGNTTQDNTLTLDDASKSYTNVYGGWTSGTGTKAAAEKQNNSLNNTVNYTAGTLTGTLYGGYAAAGEASGNTVNLGAGTSAANIYGGFGSVTKNNTINLKGARVTGTIYGGSAANGTGNTLAVYKPSEVQNFEGVQNLHFHTDELTAGNTTPLLKLGTTTKDIRGLNIGVDRRGDAPKLKKGDKLLLMKTTGSLTTDDKIENKLEGKQGMARRYTYEIKKENTGELTATVTHAGLGDDAKSPVETRAGLSNLINQGADYIVESGIAAAETTLRTDAGAGKSGKSAQRNTAVADNASYHLWAGVGANSMRVESGSHVDSKGWSLGVGWAREDAMKDGAKRLFSPFVEYGRGSYDSYLDNGTHGSGAISYLGIGVLGKLTQKDGLWFEGSVRSGRATSDYQLHGSSDADYDGSNTYYGIHLGIGKTVELKKDAAIDAYARYFWSHQNGMSVKLSSGDNYDFAAVDSHRLRLGFRYSQKDQQQGEFYTGLAWEYEFDGEARASIGGDAAPSPSLKGSSTMLELGYRFMPKNSRVSYDLHLNGWQGKRKGITGGASVKWMF